jgi:hypothetical protein
MRAETPAADGGGSVLAADGGMMVPAADGGGFRHLPLKAAGHSRRRCERRVAQLSSNAAG